jgi:hypothetical protein
MANAADKTAELSPARIRHGAAIRRSRFVRRWRQTKATGCPRDSIGIYSSDVEPSAAKGVCGEKAALSIWVRIPLCTSMQ